MARRRILTVQLPPTTCTPEMKAQVVSLADKKGVSIADVVREAIALFLRENVGLFDSDVDNINKEAAQ